MLDVVKAEREGKTRVRQSLFSTVLGSLRSWHPGEVFWGYLPKVLLHCTPQPFDPIWYAAVGPLNSVKTCMY